MRFCLQCGVALTSNSAPAMPHVGVDARRPAAPVAPLAPPPAPAPRPPVTAAPQPSQREAPTVPLKIAPTPVIARRPWSPAENLRPSLGDDMAEVDDESLKKSFLRRVTHPGAVLCRFCRGPLDLNGEFCEQCGAPITEAAPPGTIQPKPQPPASPVPPPAPPPQVGSAPAHLPGAAPHPLPKPTVRLESAQTTAMDTPPPVVPASPPAPPAEEHPPGLVSRLKGLFKKG
jgi:hypothetical protein